MLYARWMQGRRAQTIPQAADAMNLDAVWVRWHAAMPEMADAFLILADGVRAGADSGLG